MSKSLRIASYLVIASVCWSGGILFSATVSLWLFLFFSISAGILLTVVAVLQFNEAHRDMTKIDALAMKVKVIQRWADMLADQHAIHRHLVKAFDGEPTSKELH